MVRFIHIMTMIFILPLAGLGQQGEFYLYDQHNSPLNPDDLVGFTIDSSHRVWVAGRHQVNILDNGMWKQSPFDSIAQVLSITDIQSKNGHTYITIPAFASTSESQFYEWSQDSLIFFPESYGLCSPTFSTISDDTVIALGLFNWWPHQLGEDAVGVIKNGHLEIINLVDPPHRYAYFLKDLVFDQHDLLILTNRDLYLFADDSLSLVFSGINADSIGSFGQLLIYQDQIYASCKNYGMVRFPSALLIGIEPVHQLTTTYLTQITSMANQGDSLIWIGTLDGRLWSFNQEVVTEHVHQAAHEVQDIQIDRFGNKVLLFDGLGVGFYNENALIQVGVLDGQSPSGFILHQNYPNPFNSLTSIAFLIPKQSNVQISVHDLLGRKISMLTNKLYSTGQHVVQFDATELPSGIYFYRIEAGNFSESKKMVLLK